VTTIYGINSLPEYGWEKFTKVALTPMQRISGPCTIYTLEGPLDMPTGWEGWLAIDAEGHPYPIDQKIHEKTYRKV